MRRLLIAVGLVALVTGFVAAPPSAAQQSLDLYLGGFAPSSEDARSRSGGRSDDVLVNNLNFLKFNIKDFTNVTVGGEWLVGLGDRFDAGLGLGIYSKSVPSVYADLVKEDFSEIQQNLKLRVVPFTATVRFLPLGREAAIQPYFGAGVGVLRWRYSESGEFVDSDNNIFRESFIGSEGASGPIVLGGLRVPVDSWGIG